MRHALIMKCNTVFFLVASSTQLIYALVITVPNHDKLMYDGIVDAASQNIKWAHEPNAKFPTDCVSDEGLHQKGYDVTSHDVQLTFQLWHKMMRLVKENGKPMP